MLDVPQGLTECHPRRPSEPVVHGWRRSRGRSATGWPARAGPEHQDSHQIASQSIIAPGILGAPCRSVEDVWTYSLYLRRRRPVLFFNGPSLDTRHVVTLA